MRMMAKDSGSVELTVDEDLVIEGYEKYIDEAKVTRDEYGAELTTLIYRYTIKDEFEAISGDIVWETSGQRREWQGLRDGFEAEIQLLNEKYRKEFFGECVEPTVNEETKKKASAWSVGCNSHFFLFLIRFFSVISGTLLRMTSSTTLKMAHHELASPG